MYLSFQSLLDAYTAVFRETCTSFSHPPCLSVTSHTGGGYYEIFSEVAVGCRFGPADLCCFFFFLAIRFL